MTARLKIDPNLRHGIPVVRGTRVLVSTILGALGAGDSIKQKLQDYSNITREDIDAAFEFTSQPSDCQTLAYEAGHKFFWINFFQKLLPNL